MIISDWWGPFLLILAALNSWGSTTLFSDHPIMAATKHSMGTLTFGVILILVITINLGACVKWPALKLLKAGCLGIACSFSEFVSSTPGRS